MNCLSKKLAVLFLAMALVVTALPACGGDTDSTTPGAQPTSPPATGAPTHVVESPGQPTPTAAIIVDNADPGFTIESGEWEICQAGYCGGICYGADFRFAEPGCSSCQARFNLNVANAGDYDIYAWWPWGEDRATDTRFTIEYSGGVTTIDVDQRNSGDAWYWLEMLTFQAGESVSVIVEGSSTGYANADAIALTPAGAEPPTTPISTPSTTTPTPVPTASPTPTEQPTITPTGPPPRTNLRRIFFLHHSVGQGIVIGFNDAEYDSAPPGTVDMRTHISNYNSAHGTNLEFWDHGYNLSVDYGTGLTDAGGTQTGMDYAIPNTTPDDLDPEDWGEQPGGITTPAGFQALWTSTNADWERVRNQIMDNFDVIAFKSCYYDSKIDSDETLDVYGTRYLAMRDYFDAHPEKLFVVIPPPPWNPSSPEDGGITAAEANRARIFANWLKSTSANCAWYSGTVAGFLNGDHPNIVCFDVFDELADRNNVQRSTYRYGDDNHPNSVANNHVAEIFSQFLINATLNYSGS